MNLRKGESDDIEPLQVRTRKKF